MFIDMLVVIAGEQQIELLSRTTVLISTIGSRSFRLVFLPDGAQSIIVGPPEWRQQDGRTSFPHPFDETDRCWDYLGYVSVFRHHVVMGKVDDPSRNRNQTYLQMRDEHVTVEMEDILPIVKYALSNVRPWVVPDFSTGMKVLAH